MSITLTHSLPACPTRLGAETLAPGTAAVFRILQKLPPTFLGQDLRFSRMPNQPKIYVEDASCAKVSWSARCSSRPPAHRLRLKGRGRPRWGSICRLLPRSVAGLAIASNDHAVERTLSDGSLL